MDNEKAPLEIMDFWAEWCGPCHVMKPIIEEIEKEYAGKITFNKINVDEQPELSDQYNIRSIPTMLFRKDGIIADQVVGAIPKDQLTQKIDALLKPAHAMN